LSRRSYSCMTHASAARKSLETGLWEYRLQRHVKQQEE
jgi:hypothetical protein